MDTQSQHDAMVVPVSTKSRGPRRFLQVVLALVAAGVIGLGVSRFLPALAAPDATEEWTPLLTWDEGQILGTARMVRNWGEEGSPITLPAVGPAEPVIRQWLILPTVRESGALRISVDVEWIDAIDAVELTLHASPEPTPVWWMVPQGISCQFAGYGGTETNLSFNHEADRQNRQGQLALTFAAGRRYRLMLEAVDGQARMSVDGVTIMELPELLPVSTAGSVHIGLRFWAPVRLHALRVERRRIPMAGTPIATGDALAAVDIQAAMRWYLRVADDHAGTQLAALALVKAAACAAAVPGEDATLSLIRHRLEAEKISQTLRDQVDSVNCLQYWRTRRYDEALDLAEALQTRNPEARIAQHLLVQRRGHVPAPYGRRLAVLASRMPDVHSLDLSGLDLVDVNFLAGLPVANLDLSANPLTDIEGLRGLPLVSLRLADTEVSNLSALSGMRLGQLHLQGCPVADLTALRGIPINDLDLNETAVRDLAALAGMPLRRLCLNRSGIIDLTPLAGSPLEILTLVGTGVHDLSPLRGCPIRTADFRDSRIRDPSPIANPALQVLRMARSPLSDVRSLAAAPALVELDLAGTAIVDLEPLAGLNLRELDISGTKVHDLTGISTAQLEELNLDATQIRDVQVLSGAPLRQFSARGTPLASILPLLDCPLERVELADSRAEDFSLLARIPTLRVASFNGIFTEAGDWQAAAQACTDAGRPDLALCCRVAEVEERDPAALAALAQDQGGVRRLRLGRRYEYNAARALASTVGATLAWPREAQDFRTIMEAIGLNGEVWSDLRLVDGVPAGPDGQILFGIPGERGRNRDHFPVHLFWSAGDRGISRTDSVASGAEKWVVLQWP